MDGSRKRYDGHCNDLVTDFGLKWIKEDRDKDKPFVAMIQFKAPHRNWSAAERHLNLFKGVTMPEPDTLFDDYANRSKVLAEHAMGIDKHMYWGHDMKFHGENLFPEHFSSGIRNAQYARMTDKQKKAWDAVYEPENQKFIADVKAGKLSSVSAGNAIQVCKPKSVWPFVRCCSLVLSECTMPRPALIRFTSPGRIAKSEPRLSLWTISPCNRYVKVARLICG